MFGIPDTIMWMVGGWLLKEQLGPKQAPAAAPQAPQVGAPQLMPWREPQAPMQGGAYAPGMPVEVTARKPVGPVALDAHIEPRTEEGVWQCLSDTNIEAARRFAVSLSQSGLPVAAGVVSYHVHVLAQVKAAQEAQAAHVRETEERRKASASAPTYTDPPAPPERKRTAKNGAPVAAEGPAPEPFEPKPAPRP